MPKSHVSRLSSPKGSVVVFTVLALGVAFATTAGALSPQLNVSKMGGDIDYSDVPDGGTFKTMGGDIHLGKVRNGVTVTTMGGNISVDSADGSVKAKTMGGNISLRSADASVDATTMGGSVEVTLVKGDSGAAHEVTLTSMNGKIILTVPNDYPMTVDIDLAYTKGNEQRYKIAEKLGLEQSGTNEWDYSHGSPRKHLYAKGRVGDGRNHVTIKTVNGDVIIKGERSQL